MGTVLMDSTATSDEALWHASQGGDREAFGRIVRRYQSLVCALAYSRTGNLASSQDLAQETFVTAWRQLADLREPSRLRSWLCGIVRNLAANAARAERRRGGPAEALDVAAEQASPADDPETQAVTHEEESLLWRALAGMPEHFRDPLVLFYREERSVAEVATQLDLSEDAVKQRLSRGRAMLREEMAGFVEAALARSRPTAAFTAAVLGAIALASPAPAAAAAIAFAATGGATAGVAASTAAGAAAVHAAGAGAGAAASHAAGAGAGAAATSKGAITAAGAGAVIVGPVAGLTTAWIASKAVGLTARSEPERASIAKAFRQAILFCVPAVILLLALIAIGLKVLQPSPWFFVAVTTIWTLGLLAFLLRLGQRTQQDIAQIRVATGTEDAAYAEHLAARGLRLVGGKRVVSTWRWLGWPLFAFASGGMDAGAAPARAVAWIAVGDLAVSPFLAVGGLAIAPIAIGGVTVGVLSLSVAGIAVGGLAIGSLAAGWWAFGAAAVGWKAAAGGAAIAHDYAIGGLARAAQANTPAAIAWFRAQWFATPVRVFVETLPWLILLSIVLPIGLALRRGWQLRRPTPPRQSDGADDGGLAIIEEPTSLARTPAPSAAPAGATSAASPASATSAVGDAGAASAASAASAAGAASPASPANATTTQRLHGLDALRAAALVSGVVLHSALPYVLPAGAWAVGTRQPQPFLGWLVYYLHSFRLEAFFLLAGFFGALVVGRRGVAAYVRDRAIRIALVFVVALYPMKFVLAALWIAGGRATGWLHLPPAAAGLPWYTLSLGFLTSEPWPAITLTHLWFLYVLSCTVALFLLGRAIVRLAFPRRDTFTPVSRILRTLVASRAWPLLLGAAVTPLLARMHGMDIDTPDQSLAWHMPVLALYTLFFSLGWWLQGQTDLLKVFTTRRNAFLTLGLLASVLALIGIGARYAGGDWATAHATGLRWATSFGTGVTMTASVFGWLGTFLHWSAQPSARVRYLADASYWMYIVHLPIVVGLQVTLAGSGLPWWIQVPLVNTITVAVLLASYHWGVRYTWIGAWLNGRRKT
jgi:RNA polymerase sigma factor (sigma-70 family)